MASSDQPATSSSSSSAAGTRRSSLSANQIAAGLSAQLARDNNVPFSYTGSLQPVAHTAAPSMTQFTVPVDSSSSSNNTVHTNTQPATATLHPAAEEEKVNDNTITSTRTDDTSLEDNPYYPPESIINNARRAISTREDVNNDHTNNDTVAQSVPVSPVNTSVPVSPASNPMPTRRLSAAVTPDRPLSVNRRSSRATPSTTSTSAAPYSSTPPTRPRAKTSAFAVMRDALDFNLAHDDDGEEQLRRQMREGMRRQSIAAEAESRRRSTVGSFAEPSSDAIVNIAPDARDTVQPANDLSALPPTAGVLGEYDKHDLSLPPYSYWQWIRPIEQPVPASQICKWYSNLMTMASAVVAWTACVTFFMGDLNEVYNGTTLVATVYWDHINSTGLPNLFGTYRYNDSIIDWPTCYSVGVTIITTYAIAFSCLTFFIILELLRFTGIESPAKIVPYEFALYMIGAIAFVTGTCAWGGCVSQMTTEIAQRFGQSYSISWPIYGFLIGAAAFLVFGAVHETIVLLFTDFQTAKTPMKRLTRQSNATASDGNASNNTTAAQAGARHDAHNNVQHRARRLTMTGGIANAKYYDVQSELVRQLSLSPVTEPSSSSSLVAPRHNRKWSAEQIRA